VKYSLDFDGSPQDLTMTLSGAVDARSIRAFIEEMVAHPEYRAGMLILVDLSDLDTSTITQEEYESVSDAISGRDPSRRSMASHTSPPCGIASRALTTRLSTTCSVCPESATTISGSGAQMISKSISGKRKRQSAPST